MSGRSGEQGEFGDLAVPVVPAMRPGFPVPEDPRLRSLYGPDACPRGHAAVPGAATLSWNAALHLHELICDRCRTAGHTRCAWAMVDPLHHQVPIERAAGAGLELVLVPPPVDAAPGWIELHIDGDAVASIEMQLCGVDRAGVIVRVHTDEAYRRRGYARVLVLAALARRPGYRWTTTAIPDDGAARGVAAGADSPRRTGRVRLERRLAAA